MKSDVVFVDSSALVKVYCEEEFSEQVEEFVKGFDRVRICPVTMVEVLSVITQKEVKRKLSPAKAEQARRVFRQDLLSGFLVEVPLPRESYLKASELVVQYARMKFFTMDAIQVVAAIESGARYFPTADRDQARVADLLNLNVVWCRHGSFKTADK